ncbi:MAG: MurR/RpiR family transcriptional regulator [Lachnospiraceae bacterium]|nr:MurR/RpiR family transcriptional regulator [Lachnospiraceae bacterium]
MVRLEELVNQNYHRLNENDLLIWRYIQSHKKECQNIAIEDLAHKCCISRTTISRFTQKLSFRGFREFKVHLQMEYAREKVDSDNLVDEVCENYIQCIKTAKSMDMSEICEHIYKARRLFAFGTGESQRAAVGLLKRLFLNVKRFFITVHGKSEIDMAIEDLGPEDFAMIISLSGETDLAVESAKKLKAKGVYTVSITRLSENSLARICDQNLYITASYLMNVSGILVETTGMYFNVIEILGARYIAYLNDKEVLS